MWSRSQWSSIPNPPNASMASGSKNPKAPERNENRVLTLWYCNDCKYRSRS